MASVHVIGELLGASGLSGLGEEAFTVAHVLDMLSLHPSSQLSYFCKWRLVFDDPAKPNNESCWKVIQGETRGQTQVHAASSGGSLAMSNLYRQSSGKQKNILLPKMDTVWAHPIELHLATTNLDAWTCWPRLEFQVWSLDTFQLETLCGTAAISLPMAIDEYMLDVPLVLHEPHTLLESLARAVGLQYQEPDDGMRNDDEVIGGTGTLYVRLAVLSRGFNSITN